MIKIKLNFTSLFRSENGKFFRLIRSTKLKTVSFKMDEQSIEKYKTPNKIKHEINMIYNQKAEEVTSHFFRLKLNDLYNNNYIFCEAL